jgi:hypothetical protein
MANISVGIYMYSAGFSYDQMMNLGNAVLFADGMRGMSNASKDMDRGYWNYSFKFAMNNCK